MDCSLNYTSNWQHTINTRQGKGGGSSSTIIKSIFVYCLCHQFIYFINETYSTDKTTRHN